jgi:MraZ protein
MFIGEYKHNIDEKGRLALPAKFRGKLSDGVVVTKGLDNALVVYTKEEWDRIASDISKMPYTKENARAFSRMMLAGASDCKLDRQGRVNIPQNLREFANLKTNVIVVGVYSRIEVWDIKEWEEYQSKTEKDAGQIAERLDSFEM